MRLASEVPTKNDTAHVDIRNKQHDKASDNEGDRVEELLSVLKERKSCKGRCNKCQKKYTLNEKKNCYSQERVISNERKRKQGGLTLITRITYRCIRER